MIDQDWFAKVRCLSGASISDDELGRLTQVLGEEEEVLPYLLLRTDAFNAWPKVREAMRGAVKAVVRSPQLGPQLGGSASAPLRDAGRAGVAEAVVAAMTPPDEAAPVVQAELEDAESAAAIPASASAPVLTPAPPKPTADELISKLRLRSGAAFHHPEDFIERT